MSSSLKSLALVIPTAVRNGATKLAAGAHAETREASWEELVNTISNSCSQVKSLCIWDDWRASVPSLKLLWKLMALDNLQSLVLDLDCNLPSQTQQEPDIIFHHLCLSTKPKAIPLTTLHISKISGGQLGLSSLRHVSKHLPHLLNLKLPLDSSIQYQAPEDPSKISNLIPFPGLIPRHPMKALHLEEMRSGPFNPQEHRKIALFINHLFPVLGCLEVICPPWRSQGWEVIGEMRRDYQSMGNAIAQGLERHA